MLGGLGSRGVSSASRIRRGTGPGSARRERATSEFHVPVRIGGNMGLARRLVAPVEAGSSVRPVRRWRVLLAHDATAATCNSLIDAVEAALGNVDVGESSSVDDARLALRLGPHDGATGRFLLAMVCLD